MDETAQFRRNQAVAAFISEEGMGHRVCFALSINTMNYRSTFKNSVQAFLPYSKLYSVSCKPHN
jgi:hypothetical protein